MPRAEEQLAAARQKAAEAAGQKVLEARRA